MPKPPNTTRSHESNGRASSPPLGSDMGSAAVAANPTHPTGHQANRLKGVGKRAGCQPTGTKKASKSRVKVAEKPDGLNPLGGGAGAGDPLGRVAVETFPVGVYPGLLQRHFESIATALPCPVDYAGVFSLSVMATCIGRSRCIEIKDGWREYPVLWTAIVGRSGDRKSPVFQELTKPLRWQQQKFLSQYIDAKKAYKALPPDQRTDTTPPKLKQILTTDTTIEALKDVLAGNPRGIIYPSDELSGWVKAIGQYKGGQGDDRQTWLSIWSSIQIVCNRKGNPEPIVINDPFVCITGGIQPDVLPDLIDDSREDGFSARLLISFPDAVPQAEWTDDVVKQGTDYKSICTQLLSLKTSKEPIKVSPAAKEVWIDWVNRHRTETPTDNLRPTWSKAEGHCLRLTLVLHLARKFCNETKSDLIDVPSMEGGIKLIEYFKNHAKRVYRQASMSSDMGRVAKALRWIRKHGGKVTARLAHMNGFTKTSEEAKELFEFLAQEKYGFLIEGKQDNVTFKLRDDR